MSKTILITGSTDGLGKIMATELAQDGNRIILHGRNEEKAKKVKSEIEKRTGNKDIDIAIADLFSLKSIKAMTDDIKQKYDTIDVLINNAGAIMDKTRGVTSEGLEKTMMLNVYAPFLITYELIDLVKNSQQGRIINTASNTHRMASKPNFDDLQFEHKYSPSNAYGTAKLFVIWLTRHWDKVLKENGIDHVTANVWHPGAAATSFGQGNDKGLINNIIFKAALPFMSSPQKGASTAVYLARSNEVRNVSGKYFGNSKEEQPKDKHYSEVNEQKIWDHCMQICESFLTDKNAFKE
ncbi:SDR family NAD(P)-dependent oxidoreductase [Mammaliicoccus sciuri]|uniref:SDR family NAD(P)-dependent oxidoreductase n=1 Tax=Mammaliicoccus sciuri TaxID=1296 RepID=UPI0021D082FD|nr:SDR family NAD(P)-dependent oxidoreductase [Mammaliicoccus sciuri]UXU83937.1 SDR family NAD(P)-dependent oxidoreductase [Mammaliicoccus sciuri]UXU93784.1 SDR family NAD(P)-dependent oxidoreductase [Mammaliicoccus sciuri]UXV15732.1 SDR family NAD(P)-dependent oxidoreductase [Mammaliicoccus sciuri]UXV23994.1 SDR family NAD(P)-dependent oxidoreductase [Mammaliicoccus sciuri]UXV26775.1 SDR family NAD(P)-dependent oxidoreductase [Mammaliicoccus sciuri]